MCVGGSRVYADDSSWTAYELNFAGTAYTGDATSVQSLFSLPNGNLAWTPSYFNQLAFADSFDFKQGNYYQLSYNLQWTWDANSSYPVSLRLSLSDDLTLYNPVITSESSGFCHLNYDFEFYCDHDFTADALTIEFDTGATLGSVANLNPTFKIWVMPSDQRQTSIIGGFFDSLWAKLSSAFDKIGNWFTQLGDRIKGFFDDLLEGIKNLFVPSDGYFDAKTEELKTAFQERFGGLYTAGDLVDGLIDDLQGATETGTITFPEIKWGDDVLIPETEIDVVPDGFEFLQTFCRMITSVVLCLAFVMMLVHKFEKIIGEAGGKSGD